MVFRVSTFNTNQTLFGQAQRLQANYSDASIQASSGLKAQTFQGISADAQQLLTLQGQNGNLQAQIVALRTGRLRSNAMESSLRTIGDTLNNAVRFITNMLSGGMDLAAASASNVSQATVLRDAVATVLNNQVGGNYLFGGSVYDRPPVDLSNPAYTPSLTHPLPDTDYYEGDSVTDKARASDAFQIDYGVLASEQPFEQALRGLSLIINNPTNATLIQDALDLIRTSISGLASLSGRLGARMQVIDQYININEATSEYLIEAMSGIRDADTAEAATRMSQFDVQLQASYSAMSRLLQLRLTDFLR